MIGCELSHNWRGRAREIVAACLQHGLLALVAGPDVLRLAPPLIISEEEIAHGLQLLETALVELAG